MATTYALPVGATGGLPQSASSSSVNERSLGAFSSGQSSGAVSRSVLHAEQGSSGRVGQQSAILSSSFGGGLGSSLGASFGGGLSSSFGTAFNSSFRRVVEPQVNTSRILDQHMNTSYFNSSGQGSTAMQDMSPEQMHELNRLQLELQGSKLEETRIRQALQMHESVIQKNRAELNRYRTYMDQRDSEMRKLLDSHDDRMLLVLEEYKERYMRERSRLQEALVKSANCAQVVSDGLNECLAIEVQLFGYSPEELRKSRRVVKDQPSLIQALRNTGMDHSVDSRPLSIGSSFGDSDRQGGASTGASIDRDPETMLA